MARAPFPTRAQAPRGSEEKQTIARGELLAWVERALARTDVTLPEAFRQEGQDLVAAWKWRRKGESTSE